MMALQRGENGSRFHVGHGMADSRTDRRGIRDPRSSSLACQLLDSGRGGEKRARRRRTRWIGRTRVRWFARRATACAAGLKWLSGSPVVFEVMRTGSTTMS